MNDLVENTLQIIARMSMSKYGYLLKINNNNFEILKNIDANPEEFNLVNDNLFNIYVSNGIDTESVLSQPHIIKLLNSNSIQSAFIKELLSISERNESVYILLFSEDKNQYTDETKDKILSVLTILSNQVKRWIENGVVTSRNYDVRIMTGELNENKMFNDWEENFNNLVDTSPDMIFILDRTGKLILVNKQGLNLLEYSTDEIKGRHITDLIEREYKNDAAQYFNEVIDKNYVITFETGFSTKYEKFIPSHVSCRAIRKHGEIIGMLGICRNIGEQKNFEIELKKLKPKIIEANRLLKVERARVQQQKSLIEELNRLKNEFISNISHEFRTPLASIIGFSETIDSDPDLPPEMKKEFNTVILNEGKRLAKLINNVLDISKMEGGKIVLNHSRIDGIKLVQEVVNANLQSAKEKNITLTYDHPSEEVIIEADNDRLYQVLDALINNAIKFTNEFGRIKVIASNLFREFEIIISDTGVGIPEKDLPYIFQKFYRVSRPGSEIPGTGVGLVFVKQMIDLHKGLINVHSEIGSGTTFMLKLPKTGKIEKNRGNT